MAPRNFAKKWVLMLVVPFARQYLAIKSSPYKFKISASEVRHTQKAKLLLFLLPSSFVLLPPLFSFTGHFILGFILKGNFFRKTFRIMRIRWIRKCCWEVDWDLYQNFKLSLTFKTDDVSSDTMDVTTQVVMGGSGANGFIKKHSHWDGESNISSEVTWGSIISRKALNWKTERLLKLIKTDLLPIHWSPSTGR